MKADYTRFTFRPRKRFTSVRLQQGRVQLDSDWNELEEITEHLERTEARDVIGVRGAPENGGGFAVEALDAGTADFRLTNGRIYVGGLLCELQPERLPIVGFPSANKIELPSAILDGRAVVEGDWLELDATGETPKLFRVTNVKEASVTLTASPSKFGPVDKNPTARRALTYMTQPELPRPAPARCQPHRPRLPRRLAAPRDGGGGPGDPRGGPAGPRHRHAHPDDVPGADRPWQDELQGH